MNLSLSRAAALALLGTCVGTAVAGLQVLADTGRTVTSVQYLVHALDSSDSDTETSLVSFPVVAPGLTPGKLERVDQVIDMPAWLTRPIFIVGNDAASTQWLMTHHVALLRLGAAGIVIAVPDVAGFKAMRRATSLPLVPHPAPQLTQTLLKYGITHYPLLLLESGDVVQDLAAPEAAGRVIGSKP